MPEGLSQSHEQEARHQNFIERLKEERAKLIEAEAIDPEVVRQVEFSSTEIYRLKAEIRLLYDSVKDYLPSHKHMESEGTEIPATWEDIIGWLNDGQLEAHFRNFEEKEDPEAKPRLLDRRAQNKVKKIQRALDLQAEATNILYANGEETTDEQRLTRFFYRFRLKELAESRILQKDLLGHLEVNQEDTLDAINDGDRWEDVDELTKEKKQIQEDLESLVNSSPESYYDYWAKELLKAQKILEEGDKIYETPSVVAKINKVLAMVRNGRAVFIHGETGSGKTELARHIAEKYLGRKPEVVSGHKTLEFPTITETQDIKVRSQEDPRETRKKILARVDKDLADPELNTLIENLAKDLGIEIDAARKIERDRLELAYAEYYKNPVEVGSRLQQYYRAAAEGSMVIIDEMNAIPHHTLIALNDLLTKKPLNPEDYAKYMSGDLALEEIDTRHIITPIYGEDPIVIKPGFCVIATGNWKPEDGEHYKGRQDIDAAYLRRFGIIQYDYLPNPIEGTLEGENVPIEEERGLKEKAELYRMLCAKIIDKDLTATLPENTFEQLDELAKVARVIQDGFSDKSISDAYLPESSSGNAARLAVKDVLKENVLDIGKLTQYIIDPWKKEGYRRPLEIYIFDNYISRSKARPTEFLFLYNAFQLNGFFSPDQGWPSVIDLMANNQAASQANNTTAQDIEKYRGEKLPEVLKFADLLEKSIYHRSDLSYDDQELISIPEPKMRFFSPIEIVDKVIGRPPQRTLYPDLEREIAQEGEAEKAVEIDETEIAERQHLRDEIDRLEAEIIEKNKFGKDRLEFAQTLDETFSDGTSQVEMEMYHHNIGILSGQLAQLTEMLEKNAPIEEIKELYDFMCEDSKRLETFERTQEPDDFIPAEVDD